MPEKIRWSRVFVEGVVIVGSILLAFGIQAAWEWRQDRALEHDALERLLAEFSEADAIFVETRANHLSVANAAVALLEHTRPTGPPGISADSIAALLATIRVGWTLDASFSALSALEASGQLTSIESRDLLVQLATFRSVLADLQADEQALAARKRDRLAPYLDANVSVRAMPIFRVRGGESSAFPGGFEDILQHREFENLVSEVQRTTRNTIANYNEATEVLTVLLGFIRDELGEQ